MNARTTQRRMRLAPGLCLEDCEGLHQGSLFCMQGIVSGPLGETKEPEAQCLYGEPVVLLWAVQ